MRLFFERDRKRLKRNNGHGFEFAAFGLFRLINELNRPNGNDCSELIALQKTVGGMLLCIKCWTTTAKSAVKN